MKIFLDIGNTFVKTASSRDNKLEDGLKVLTEKFVEQPKNYLQDSEPENTRIFISSVRGEIFDSALIKKINDYGYLCNLIKVHEEFCGFKTLYNPDSLGVDRWLACLAANYKYGHDIVVVDAGTAITVDIVSGNGLHLGGYITAGLGELGNKINSSTNLKCEDISLIPLDSLPAQTDDALISGNLIMMRGFFKQIEKIITNARFGMALNNDFKWVVTGGDCHLAGACLSVPFFTNPKLVLEGALIYSLYWD